ncbi:hypothetical protein BVRB_025540 [Beta vulgaris subsp. vulgaris]|uniref:Uncharacterized protein n=1 Tax=Beta vulgaris subsp. vulgaris TaxID=3555 RepID=A0A0J8AZA3_BETVV|nr:hypothetical protein BVRB_025540 [Beta vulgaris subsp. vulgaris]
MQAEVTGLESESAKILQRRRDMLQVCALEQIPIPRLRNKRKRATERSDDYESDDDGDRMEIDRSTGASQSQLDVQEIESIEADTIDYRQLKMPKEVQGANEYKAIKDETEEKLARMNAEMETLAPNLKSFDQFDEIKGRVASAGADFEAAKHQSKEASESFNQIRQERLKKFMNAYNHISGAIDEIYKQLTRSARFPLGGTAYLSLENTEDPFIGGIKYFLSINQTCLN